MSISRRDLLKSGISGALLARVSPLLSNVQSYLRYPESMLRSSRGEFELSMNVIEGALPQDIYGYAFLTEGFTDESEVFVKAGKGAINRIDFTSSSPVWKRKLIKTPSVLMSYAIDKDRYNFSTVAKMVYQSPRLGYMNTANTNVVPIGGSRLALTFEGGRHWELDAKTLNLITPIGERSEWKSAFTGMAEIFFKNLIFPSIRTTAHPYYDNEKNEFFSINYANKTRFPKIKMEVGEPFTRIIKWDGKSKFKSWNIVDYKTGKDVEIIYTSHSFLVTRNYIGIVDTPASVEAEKIFGAKITRASVPYTKIWWIKKSDLNDSIHYAKAKCYTLKREFIDLVCDYNDDDGVVVYSGSIQSSDQTEFLQDGDELYVGGKVRKELCGLSSGPNDLSGFVKLRLNITENEISGEEEFLAGDTDLWGIDFPAFKGNYAMPEKFKHMYWSTVGYNPDQILKRLVDLYKDQKYRNIPTKLLPKTNHGAAIIHLNCEEFKIENKYVFPENCAIGSLQFVGKRSSKSQKDGYLMSIVSIKGENYSEYSSGQEVWVFDASDLSKGPICKLSNKNLDVAYTLHSSWLASIDQPRNSDYHVDLIEESQSVLDKQPDFVKNIFKNEIKKYFKL